MQSRGAYMALSILTGLLIIVLGALFLAKPVLSLASIILSGRDLRHRLRRHPRHR